jgi:hypothetical protein
MQPEPLLRSVAAAQPRVCSGSRGAAEGAAQVEEADAAVELLRDIQPLGDGHAADEIADERYGGAHDVVEERGERGRDVVGVVCNAVAEVERERVVGTGQLKVQNSEVADEGGEAGHPGGKGGRGGCAVGRGERDGMSARAENKQQQNRRERQYFPARHQLLVRQIPRIAALAARGGRVLKARRPSSCSLRGRLGQNVAFFYCRKRMKSGGTEEENGAAVPQLQEEGR